MAGENADLLVWDVAAEKQEFKAKPQPLDWVGMYKKIYITSLAFVPGEGPQRILAGDDRCVRVFDFRAQRRAVQTIEYGETLIKAVAVTPGERRHAAGASIFSSPSVNDVSAKAQTSSGGRVPVFSFLPHPLRRRDDRDRGERARPHGSL